MNEEISKILNAIDTINTALVFDVDIPSLNKTIRFRQLTTGQQKKFAKQLLTADGLSIVPAVLDIAKQNCLDQTINFDNLTLVDLLLISIKIRIYSVGDFITLRVPIDKDENSEKQTFFDVKIDLKKLYNDILSKADTTIDDSIIMDQYPYEIYIGMPSVKAMCDLKDVENFDDQDIYETTQYIKSIKIRNNTGEKITIDFNDLGINDKISILEKIPNPIIQKTYETLVDKIKKINGISLYRIKHKNKDYSQSISILSANFFT